jgi:hypothetical protein
MLEKRRFLNDTEKHSRKREIPHACPRSEIPGKRRVHLGNRKSSAEIEPLSVEKGAERPGDAVKNLPDQSRPQGDGKRFPRSRDGFSQAHPLGVLVDLNDCLVIVHADDFSDESALADANHLAHGEISHALSPNHGAVD